jgi:hypothetical protein
LSAAAQDVSEEQEVELMLLKKDLDAATESLAATNAKLAEAAAAAGSATAQEKYALTALLVLLLRFICIRILCLSSCWGLLLWLVSRVHGAGCCASSSAACKRSWTRHGRCRYANRSCFVFSCVAILHTFAIWLL